MTRTVDKNKKKGVKPRQKTNKPKKAIEVVTQVDNDPKIPMRRKKSRRVSLKRQMFREQRDGYKRKNGYLPATHVIRKVRDVIFDNGTKGMKLSRRGAFLIQHIAEFKAQDLLNKAKYLTMNRKRKKLSRSDIETVLLVSDPSFFQRHHDVFRDSTE